MKNRVFPLPTDVPLKVVAERAGRHIETMRLMARTGELPGAYRVRKRWYLPAGAVAELFGEAPAASSE